MYLAEGFPIVPPDTTTTTTTTTTTVSTFIPPPPPPPPACVHVDGQPPYGRLDFLFGDGRGGWADLNGYFSPVCSNGALVGLQTVTAGSGRAGNLAHPFYLLSAGPQLSAAVALTLPVPAASGWRNHNSHSQSEYEPEHHSTAHSRILSRGLGGLVHKLSSEPRLRRR